MFKLLLPLILVLAAFVGAGDIIHACVNNDNGVVRIVNADTVCGGNETALQWGMAGIQGQKGDAGPAGPVGAQGPKGDTGAPGAKGDTGAAGAKGDPGPRGDTGVGNIGCNTDQIAKWDGDTWVCSNELANLKADVAALQDLLTHFSRNGNTVTLTGANLQVVSGTGKTDGEPNALGNIIIGYNEPRPSPDFNPLINRRTGSHMLVVGKEHNYTRFGGIVVGRHNTTSGDYASVSGGGGNSAGATYASVSGGIDNIASRQGASVSGGQENSASGDFASVSGGRDREADGIYDWQAGLLFQTE